MDDPTDSITPERTGAPIASDTIAADQAFAAFFASALDQEMRLRPTYATHLGDYRFGHLIEDVSPAGRARWTEHIQRTLTALPQAVDRSQLSFDAQVDYDILQTELQRSLWVATHERPFNTDPRIYDQYALDGIYRLVTQSTLAPALRLQQTIARLEQIPSVLAVARDTLTHPSRVVVETASRQNRGSISFITDDLASLMGPADLPPAFTEAAAAAVAALRVHQRFLDEDLLPRAHGSWRSGRDRFQQKLAFDLEAGMTADQLLEDAVCECNRVRLEMACVARQLWSRLLPHEALPPDDTPGQHAVISRVLQLIGRDHGEADQLCSEARSTIAGIIHFITARDLLELPDPHRCRLIEMPEFRRGNSVADLSCAPPLDRHADSIYAISPPPQHWAPDRVTSFLEEYNRHMLRILSIHEAYPGHYVQLEHANRVSSLVRRVLGSGVFMEGWAVYCEQMMLDEGYGQGDLSLRLTQLKFYLRAVANAILDHRLHCTDMTDAEARRLLVDEAFQSESEADLKLIRAKLGSCQLSTYFIGRMAMVRCRERIQRKMGAAFSLRRFHEAVLAQSSVPVTYLLELVRRHLDLPVLTPRVTAGASPATSAAS